MNPKARAKAVERWRQGDQKVGRLIFEAIKPEDRPSWAARVLRIVISELDAPPAAVLRVLEIAGDEKRWGEAHAAFQAVRELTLREEKAGGDRGVRYLVLFVAENCAKVIYNASGRPAPFDFDTGWWLPGCARAVALKVTSIEGALESALFDEAPAGRDARIALEDWNPDRRG